MKKRQLIVTENGKRIELRRANGLLFGFVQYWWQEGSWSLYFSKDGGGCVEKDSREFFSEDDAVAALLKKCRIKGEVVK